MLVREYIDTLFCMYGKYIMGYEHFIYSIDTRRCDCERV
jgi:hypothetical protein